MMILSRNKGISNYYEVCDVELSGNYEEKMLIYNHMNYLPEAEIRTLDNNKSMYVKVDGFSPLSNIYGRCVPTMQDVMGLVGDIKNCIKEIREYLLNPACLVLNLKYWREHELSKQYMQYINDNFEKLWFNDQDTLNGVLFNKKLMLPVTYNFQVLFLKNSIFNAQNVINTINRMPSLWVPGASR